MEEFSRDLVRRRADGRCEYCRLPDIADEWPFHIEHIVAKQHGGTDDAENLCWSCFRCNLRKGTNLASIDPETQQRANLYDPRRQNWSDLLSRKAGDPTPLAKVKGRDPRTF